MPARFTVAIPTHDRRDTVLLAVRSALAQSRPPDEVIVLCDGCTDGTADALHELGDPRVEPLELPKAPGYGYAHRNRSLELARGDVILWLGDDDLLLPDHLERIGALWDSGRLDLVQAHGAVVGPDDAMEWFGADWSVPFFREDLGRFNPSPMASVSIRTAFARDIGGWDAGLPRWADWDLWRRALAAGARTATSPEPTVLHFRATRRDQPWEDRVRQNRRFLERLASPEELLELRVQLHRLRAERDATEAAYVRDLLEGKEWLDSEVARLTGEAARLTGEVARLTRALEAIEGGGWWRLRERLLPVLRALGRGRPHG